MYKERTGELFYDVVMLIDSALKVDYQPPKNVIYVQCGSCDCMLGAGIAVTFNKMFNVKNEILKFLKEEQELNISSGVPKICEYYYTTPVITFFTKHRYWHKPTQEDFKIALSHLPEAVKRIKSVNSNITEVRMPMIGTGLDKLSKDFVRGVLKEQSIKLEEIGVDLIVIDKNL